MLLGVFLFCLCPLSYIGYYDSTLILKAFLICSFSVENAYIDEKEDACDALGEIAFNTG